MRRSFKSVFAVGVACLGATALPSCATNDSMMFVVGVYARRQGACAPVAEADAPILAKGTLDVLFAREYRAALLIGNQLTERGSREQLRTETSRVSLKGAEVQLETLQGDAIGEAFSSTATGFVDAASGTSPSLSIMYASLIPGSLVPGLPLQTIVAKVRVFGDTLGGEEVESSELSFPIEICRGCLVSYPASAAEPAAAAAGTYQCRSDSADDEASGDADLPCVLGVDFQAPCTTCVGAYDECSSPRNNPYYTP
jgi:hypothetical protein